MNDRRNNNNENIGSFYMGRMRPPVPQPRRVLPRGALTGITLLAFAAILWYAYPQGQEKYDGVDVPLIKADASSYKFKPDDPGGMEIRHQDSTVFDPLEKKSAQTTEKLVPSAEAPIEAKLDAPTPQLKLDAQMQDIGNGAEKIVTTPEPSKAEAIKPQAKPVTKKEEKPAVAGATYIQLGSYRDAAGAKRDWEKFQKQYPQYLGKLDMRTQKADLGAKGVFHRLQAGPVTEARAGEICKSMKGGCVVVR